MSSVQTIQWVGGADGHLRLLDQTALPTEVIFQQCVDPEQVREAICALRVRGAPAIGVSAAYALVLWAQQELGKCLSRPREDLVRSFEEARLRLLTSRPTAVNLAWALERVGGVFREWSESQREPLTDVLLREAHAIAAEDQAMCAAMGRHGAELIQDGEGILTHCNTGALATAGIGTALGIILTAANQGKKIRVFADETRPLLQGARLTAWELQQAGIDVTLICDNMAAQVMKEGRVQRVLVGADRITANGDTANKIGTYGVAVLARAHGIPFYVAAPSSTFDRALADGASIPIEQRHAEEIIAGFGKQTAPTGVRVYNPAFDVTPHHLIAGIITEKGIIQPVTEDQIQAVLGPRNPS